MLVSRTTRINAGRLGLSVREVKGIAKRATEIKHSIFTHATTDWLLKIINGSVHKIQLVNCTICKDEKSVQVFNECQYCNGAGCENCGGYGDVKSNIPCPHCE